MMSTASATGTLVKRLTKSKLTTIEKEERGQLPFLDVLVRKDTLSQQFHFSVFRKPTHTDSYINYKSNHHPATKIATILCLRKRAEDICQGEDLK